MIQDRGKNILACLSIHSAISWSFLLSSFPFEFLFSSLDFVSGVSLILKLNKVFVFPFESIAMSKLDASISA